jgi:hypothetical protein
MALEYRLILAGENTPEEVAARAVLDPDDRRRLTPSGPVFSADLYERLGFELTVAPARNAYYEAQGDPDTDLWDWEPGPHVRITFRVDKDPDRMEVSVRNVLEIVARLLALVGEDAALILNGDSLLLTRVAGVVRKHRRATWWSSYLDANEIIPD